MKISKQFLTAGAVGLIATAATAEVTTGPVSGNLSGSGYITLNGLGVEMSGVLVPGVFADFGVFGSAGEGQGFEFLLSGNTGNGDYSHTFFVEGQELAANTGTVESFILYRQDIAGPGSILNSLGNVGESQYIGFLITQDNGAGGVETNFGFVQFYKQGENSWDYVGWAYETVAGRDLVTFNLIPAPSSLALLGAGGLCLTRRRRQ